LGTIEAMSIGANADKRKNRPTNPASLSIRPFLTTPWLWQIYCKRVISEVTRREGFEFGPNRTRTRTRTRDAEIVMHVDLPTGELLNGANFPLATAPSAVVADRGHGEAALREAIDVARAAFSQRRKRLGKLTPEQELVIEDILNQTVNVISKMAGRVFESLPSSP
jgi:hypothetical protein